ncbi:trypsin-like peptidase domain-containing protein [uncultured Draconibacterium sp.]|uniref:trypsin-like serine protease n=1 Tax=uncultured Draconibacterium sp. TaxID=1573823 RepID=UPI00321773A7
MKKTLYFLLIVVAFVSCSKANISVSPQPFPSTSLINHYEYFEKGNKFNELGTAFLLSYKNDTFAITAKHILAVLKPDSLKNLTLDNFIKGWTMSPLNKENERVVLGKLLNEDKNESLKSKTLLTKDWLVFSIKENTSKVVPLEFREKPLPKGEKLYAIGWTRHMKDGDQRVYEFEYYKTRGTHHLMKKRMIPEKMGGLSGAPVVDKDGKLVGIVSNSKFSVLAMQEMFAPVGTADLKAFLDNYLSE